MPRDRDTVAGQRHARVGFARPSARVRRRCAAVIDDMLGSAMAATEATFRVELEHVIGHGPHLAAALVRWSATRDGRGMSGRELAVYRVVEGQVVEAAFQLEDPQATDAFFAACHTSRSS